MIRIGLGVLLGLASTAIFAQTTTCQEFAGGLIKCSTPQGARVHFFEPSLDRDPPCLNQRPWRPSDPGRRVQYDGKAESVSRTLAKADFIFAVDCHAYDPREME